MASEGYHEPFEALSADVRDFHRAIVSLMEELEAIDWYGQRVAACTDDALRAVLAHNRKEEIEHAAMTLEWLRRKDPEFDRQLRTVLFSDRPITALEDTEPEAQGSPTPASTEGADGSLAIRSLRPATGPRVGKGA